MKYIHIFIVFFLIGKIHMRDREEKIGHMVIIV